MTTSTATATKFCSLDQHTADTVTLSLWLFDVAGQQAQVIAIWTSDYGDDETYETNLLAAETIAATYCHSLLEIDQFTFAGINHDGWALADIWQQSPTALADIAANHPLN